MRRGADSLIPYIDMMTIVRVCQRLRRDNPGITWQVVDEYLTSTLDSIAGLSRNPADMMAYIVFSLSGGYYNYGSWEAEESNHLQEVFGELVESNDITEDDVNAAIDLVFRILRGMWDT